MPKLIVLKGLQGSGKSTLAREIVKETGNTVRVNRDDLRAMMFNGEWSRHREDIVIAVEKAIAFMAAGVGMNVVIDDTNLTAKTQAMWDEVSVNLGVAMETVVMDTPLDECIRRDSQRQGAARIGRPIIENAALRAGLVKWDAPIACFDLDGTLADCEHRRHYVMGEKKNWKDFFAECGKDTPRREVVSALQHERGAGHTIVILTARPESCGDDTLAWLEKHEIPFHRIFMRRSSDKRDDEVVKEEILSFMPKDLISIIYDDRPRVIRMWRRHGLNVVDVGDGVEF